MHLRRSRRDCHKKACRREILNNAMKVRSESPKYLLIIRRIGEVDFENVNLAAAMDFRNSVLCFPGNPLRARGIKKKNMIELAGGQK
jgi:hypothetical protein